MTQTADMGFMKVYVNIGSKLNEKLDELLAKRRTKFKTYWEGPFVYMYVIDVQFELGTKWRIEELLKNEQN